MKSKIIFKLFFLISTLNLSAQTYAPPAGQTGTSAMYKDSSAFINWVTGCHVARGYQDISNTSLGYASTGDSSMTFGHADISSVVSLGDGGSATCTFQYPIKNGPGNDFAVFENSFDDTFLELAFVEVSSDGINFVRFPSHSLTDTTTQTGSFGATDATKINNLAGKYKGGYGTPFDLQELAGNATLNINSITHVKIIDVVGSVNKTYATRDSHTTVINDPWPTPFPGGGFDLDAIGVINQNTNVGIEENDFRNNISIYPNPINNGDDIIIYSSIELISVTVFNYLGQKLFITTKNNINTSELSKGIYFIEVMLLNGTVTKKIVIQ